MQSEFLLGLCVTHLVTNSMKKLHMHSGGDVECCSHVSAKGKYIFSQCLCRVDCELKCLFSLLLCLMHLNMRYVKV